MLKGKRVNSLGSPKCEVLQKPTCSQLGPVGLPIAHMGPSRRCPHISLDKPDTVAKPTIVLSWRKPTEVELFSRKAHIAAEQRNSPRKSRAQPEQASPVLPPLPSASHTHSSSCLPPSPTPFPPLPTRASCPEGTHILPRHCFRTGQERKREGGLSSKEGKVTKREQQEKTELKNPWPAEEGLMNGSYSTSRHFLTEWKGKFIKGCQGTTYSACSW